MECTNYFNIIIVLILTGILGGLANFLVAYNIDATVRERWINFFTSIILGICAAICVPLFLRIISNDILNNLTFHSYLILSGFGVLASFYSRRFIDNLHNKVNDLEKKVKSNKSDIEDSSEIAREEIVKLKTQVQNLEESTEEIDLNNQIPEAVKGEIKKEFEKEFDDLKIEKFLEAIFNAKFSFRTANRLAKATNSDVPIISKILNHLRELGLAECRVGANGKDYWRILKYPIKIYSAAYGVRGSYQDVTDKLRSLVHNKIFTGPVSAEYLDVKDKLPGIEKYLVIHCRINGKEKELSFKDKEQFNLSL